MDTDSRFLSMIEQDPVPSRAGDLAHAAQWVQRAALPGLFYDYRWSSESWWAGRESFYIVFYLGNG